LKKKKKWPIAIGVIGIILLGGFFTVTDGLSEGEKITLYGVDLSNVPDGSYTGTYDFKRWSNTVTVHIKDNRIISIDMDNDVAAARITDCANEMFRRVIEAQDTKVDAVSGATVTSKAYLKAIEDALN